MASFRVSPTTLAADREAVQALQDLLDYTPRNPAHSTPALQQLEAELTQAEQAEGRARRALDEARDMVDTLARRFHNAVLGAKTEVIVQYGTDSLAVEKVGLKRKSERKRPSRRTAATAD
jgi:hypothetical protein